MLFSFAEGFNLFALSFVKVLVHLMTGLVPESLVAQKGRLMLNVSELFEEAPLSVVIVLNVVRFGVLELILDPEVKFSFFFGLGFLLDV